MPDGAQPDNVLFEWYERYVGEPATETEVYLGFGLFFGGCAFAALGLLAFLAGTLQYGFRTPGYATLAEPGYLLGMLSLPMALLSVVVLLPTRRRIAATAYGGGAVTLVAAAGFLWAYPDAWFDFGTRNTLLVIGTYAVGVATVTAAAGSALVAHRVEQAQNEAVAGAAAEAGAASADADSETVTDEQVEADIEEAMSGADLTLGGVERDEGRRLNLSTDDIDSATPAGDVEAKRTVNPGGVDSAVEGLNQLTGSEENVASSEDTVDEQTAALTELREQQAAGEGPGADDDEDDGIVGRFKRLFGGE